MNNSPLISIITIVFKDPDGLKKTIRSVKNQSFKDFEFLVIDGGSCQDTFDVIQGNANLITKWVSESDRGISHAFNKGLSLASGKYIQMLNAADEFVDSSSLEYVSGKLNNQDIVAFRHQSAKKNWVSQVLNPEGTIFEKAMVGHQSTFVKKTVYDDLGGYSESFKIRMDYDFFIRAFQKYALTFDEQPIVLYDPGLSGQPENMIRFHFEGWYVEYLHLNHNPDFRKRPKRILKEARRSTRWLQGDKAKKPMLRFWPF